MNHHSSINNMCTFCICTYIMYEVILFIILRLQHCLTTYYSIAQNWLLFLLYLITTCTYRWVKLQRWWKQQKAGGAAWVELFAMLKLCMLTTECCIRVNDCYLGCSAPPFSRFGVSALTFHCQWLNYTIIHYSQATEMDQKHSHILVISRVSIAN